MSAALWSYLGAGRQCLSAATRAFSTGVPFRAEQIQLPTFQRYIKTPQDFLKAVGRELDTKVTVDSWEALWAKRGKHFKADGLAVRDRRYLLWCMAKFKAGVPTTVFAHEPPPKKKIRGWGPAMQDGKRPRSRAEKARRKTIARTNGGNVSMYATSQASAA
ncbi:hypothetical protein CYLTODRAFT_486309 [Cylindrobasidium torrendii FP15055 ss-10]|uniref:Small ribosomal subunit protein mS41 n=1 Tax=Cylindrobasidium torrendii FP15055 ss-10 TaxID=1314674 RepID=A0A0D7BS89_9AGAR|nr:hypothetical protein CYLTODRAFT_486309 [Cylindrobasidium torrendii FP15055 ss-10]